MARHWSRLFVLGFIVFLFQLGNSFAADSKSSNVQNQIDITIIHVDRFGVYGPKVVFYWDPAMGKQKIDALMKAAEQSRNKKATVTYSSPSGDLSKDKRPILVDIAVSREEPKLSSREQTRVSTREENKKPVKEETSIDAEESPEDTSDVEEPQDVISSEEEPVSKPAREEKKRTTGGERLSVKESPAEPANVGGAQDISKSEEKALSKSTREEKRRIAKETGMDTYSSSPPMSAPHMEETHSSVYPEQRLAQRPSRSNAISKDEIRGFIQRVLRWNEIKDLNSVLWCYADQVNYYDRGIVTKDYIRRDMGYYYKNWNTISSSIEGDIVVIVTDQQDTRTVEFVSRYAVENSRKSLTGRVQNIWKIQRIGNELKIVDQKQKILSSENR